MYCCYKDKRQERATGIGYEEEGEEDLTPVQQEATSEDDDDFPATSMN